MKTLHLLSPAIIATLVIGLTVVPHACAQEQAQPANSEIARGTMQPPPPEQVVHLLGEKLNLTDAQKSQIMPIIADRQQRIQALRVDASMSPRVKMYKIKGILEDSDKRIEAILSKEQKQQYAQIMQRMREQFRGRMQSRGVQN